MLTDEAEILLRQIHKTWLCPIRTIKSPAFTPTKKDAGLLSTDRGRIGAEESYRRWIKQGLTSVGTMGTSIGEVHEADVLVVDDSAVVREDHASIDFRTKTSKGEITQAARKLRDAAVARGFLFRPAKV